MAQPGSNLQKPSFPGNSWPPDRVEALRLRLRLSQTAFGKLVGVVRQTVGEWERGYSEPSKLNIEALEELDQRQVKTPPAPVVQETPAEYDRVIATVIATGENRARLGVVQGYAQFVLDQLLELARKQQQVVDGIRPFSEAEGQALAANVPPEKIPELLDSIRRYQARNTGADAPADPRRGTG